MVVVVVFGGFVLMIDCLKHFLLHPGFDGLVLCFSEHKLEY